MRHVSRQQLLTFLIFCLAMARSAQADSYNSNWSFSLGCPTHDDTSASGSLSLISGGFSGGGNCSRLSNGFGKYNFTSSNGGTLRSSSIYPLQMGNLSFVPPVRTTDTTPVFSVAANCPTATKEVNWIFIQSAASRTADYFWGRSTMTPTSTTMTKYYDIDGNELFNGNYTLPVGSCSSGVIDVSGTSDFQAKIYSANDWSGFYKTGPGNVSFFAAPLLINQSYLLNKTYVGLLYSSQDGNSSRYVQVVADPSDPIFFITPYTDPETNIVDYGDFFDTITITDFNSPLPGMMRGTVERRDGSFNIVGTTEKIGCLVYETGTGGIVISCAGKNPADNTTQYSVTFNYKFPSGTPDSLFSSDGLVTLTADDVEQAYWDFTFNGSALQSDGKLVVAAKIFYQFAVIRYTAEGALDTTFNSTGIKFIDFGNYYGEAKAVAIQPDGKILVGGSAQSLYQVTSPTYFAVARLNTDGSFDDNFDGDGKVLTSYGDVVWSSDSDIINQLAIDSNNKIVAGGYIYRDGRGDFHTAIARYNSDGSLDTSFGDDGKIATSGGNFCFAMIVFPNNQIACAGSNTTDNTVMKYTTSGDLDTSFSGDGIAAFGDVTASNTSGLALQADGKLVFGGATEIEGEPVAFVGRLNTDGSLDTDFSGDGKFYESATYTSVGSIAIQDDGKILVAGAPSSFGMWRFNTNGTLDTSFNGDGIYEGTGLEATSINLAADGKPVLVGWDFDMDWISFTGVVHRIWP